MAVAALIWPLAQELPYAMGMATKKEKKKIIVRIESRSWGIHVNCVVKEETHPADTSWAFSMYQGRSSAEWKMQVEKDMKRTVKIQNRFSEH